jgi:hypothetical protein
MIKKVFISLSVILLLSFSSCGGESSKEAKELLEKILQVIGIPHSIIVNICQDENRDGICGSKELFTKITLNQDDEVEDIWRKISLTADGRYFLETRNPELPILLELQDSANVHYDEGKFTLSFNGFLTQNDDNETKEISILESMIDSNYLTQSDVIAIRNLEVQTTQDKFYSMLLTSLETNINTLRAIGLNSQEAISANLKEIADELLTSGVTKTLPEELNACGFNQVCVDTRLEKVSTELLITDSEAEEIRQEKSDTNSNPTPIPNEGTTQNNKIDISKYLVSSSMTKSYISYSKVDGMEEQSSNYTESYTVKDNVITTGVEGDTRMSFTITEDSIIVPQINGETTSIKRYVSIGDEISNIPLDYVYETNGVRSVTTGNSICILDSQIDNFSNRGYSYEGDILKLNCTVDTINKTTTENQTVTGTYSGTSTQYMKRGIDEIASIEDSCNESDISQKICEHTERYYVQ